MALWTPPQKPPAGTPVNWSHPRALLLIGAWEFNEGGGLKVFDHSRRYGDGALQNASSGQWETASRGLDLKLAAASSQYVQITHNSNFSLAGVTALTTEVWVWFNSLRNYNGLLTNTSGNAGNSFDAYVDGSGVLHHFMWGNQLTTSGLVAGKWNHIVMTAWSDSSIGPNHIRSFVNGVQTASMDTAGGSGPASPDNGNRLIIGARDDLATVIDGKFATARLWLRALSPAEVLEQYANPYGIYRRKRVAAKGPPAALNITPTGIASAEAFGTSTVTPGPVTIVPAGIASAEAFGNPSFTLSVKPSSITSAEAFGTPTVTPGAATIAPSGIASAEAFGTLHVAGPVAGAGAIASAEAFGTADIAAGIANAGAIASAEAFGTARVVGPVYAVGIGPAEVFGVPTVTGPVSGAGAIASAEAFGVAFVDVEQTLIAVAIASAEAFGRPTVALVQSILPAGIATAEAFGGATVRGGAKLIAGAGAIYDGAVGYPTITGGQSGTFLYIGGSDRSSYLAGNGATNPAASGSASGATQQPPTIQSQTLGRWSASFDLWAADGYLPALGQTVQYIENGVKLFAGCLNSVQLERISGSSVVVIHCSCVDKSGICDHRVVSAQKTYPAGMDAADAIRDIVANYLNGEGITTNNVPATLGALSADQVFFFNTVTKALDAIMTDAGGVWWVDVNGDLNTPLLPNLPAAPFSLGENSGNYRALTVTATLLDYRNVQYAVSNLKVAPAIAGPGSSGPAGVSVTETYTLPQAAAQARGFLFGSIITQFNILGITSLKVNGVAQPVYRGTQLIDLEHVWWYFPGSPYLVPPNAQNANPFPPPPATSPDPVAGDVVEISYLAQEQSVAKVSGDPLAPPGPGTGTCGSGVYEAVEQVKNISLQSDLQAIAQAVLDRSGGVPKLIQFDTDLPGLAVGQRLSIDIPTMDLAATTALITSVSGASQPGKGSLASGDARRQTFFRWTVQASTTTDLGNSVKYMERLLARTENAIPLDQALWPTFILAPSGSLAAGVVDSNLDIVRASGTIEEVVAVTPVPPTAQDLLIDILADNVSIFSSPLVIPAGTSTLVHWTSLASDPAPTWLFKDQLLKVVASYSVKGSNPTNAANVTVQIRVSY